MRSWLAIVGLIVTGCGGASSGSEETADGSAPQDAAIEAATEDASSPEADAGTTDAEPDVVYIDGYVCPSSPTYEPAIGPVTSDFRYSSAGPYCDNQCGAGGNVKYVVTTPGTVPDLAGCTRQKESGHFCCPDAVCTREVSFDSQCAAFNQPPTAYTCDGQPGNLPKPPKNGAGCEPFNGTGGQYIYCCP